MASFQKAAVTRCDTQIEFVKSHHRDLRVSISSLFLRVSHLSCKADDHVFITDDEKKKVSEKWMKLGSLQSVIELLCSEYSLGPSAFGLSERYRGALSFISKFMEEQDIFSDYLERQKFSGAVRSSPSPYSRSTGKASPAVTGTEPLEEGELVEQEESVGRVGRCASDAPLAHRDKKRNESGRGRGGVGGNSALTKSSCLNKTPARSRKGFVNTGSRRGQEKSVMRAILLKQADVSVSAKRNVYLSSPCVECEHERHTFLYCRQVPPAQKRRLARELGVCFVCLKLGHAAQHCALEYKCVKCGGRHNVRLCEKPVSVSPTVTTSRVKRERELCDPADYLADLPSDFDCRLSETGTSTDQGERLQTDF